MCHQMTKQLPICQFKLWGNGKCLVIIATRYIIKYHRKIFHKKNIACTLIENRENRPNHSDKYMLTKKYIYYTDNICFPQSSSLISIVIFFLGSLHVNFENILLKIDFFVYTIKVFLI